MADSTDRFRAQALIFETHATSLDNEAGLASGWYDVDLSPAGIKQAAELGDRYREFELAVVYCSDLLRATRTAELAFAARPIPIIVDARLRECDYGALTRAETTRVDALRLDAIGKPFPGGESYEQVAHRVRRWLDEAAGGPHAHPIVVIGHRATFYAFEHLLRGVPLYDAITAPWRWQPGWRYELRKERREIP